VRVCESVCVCARAQFERYLISEYN
jgi:hypothetical protein